LKKICSRCKEEKDISLFSKKKKSSDGYNWWCKECSSIYKKKYYKKNIEKAKEYNRKDYLNNKEKYLEYAKIYREKNESKVKQSFKNYRKKNKEKIRIRNNEYEKRRRKEPGAKIRRLRRNLSLQIRRAIGKQKNGRSWELLVEYSLEDLKKYFENKFSINWSDYGIEWEIDHIIPQTLYNFFDENEIKNISKGNKLDIELIKEHNIQDLLPKDMSIREGDIIYKENIINKLGEKYGT
jgi:hypothetical protein